MVDDPANIEAADEMLAKFVREVQPRLVYYLPEALATTKQATAARANRSVCCPVRGLQHADWPVIRLARDRLGEIFTRNDESCRVRQESIEPVHVTSLVFVR